MSAALSEDTQHLDDNNDSKSNFVSPSKSRIELVESSPASLTRSLFCVAPRDFSCCCCYTRAPFHSRKNDSIGTRGRKHAASPPPPLIPPQRESSFDFRTLYIRPAARRRRVSFSATTASALAGHSIIAWREAR